MERWKLSRMSKHCPIVMLQLQTTVSITQIQVRMFLNYINLIMCRYHHQYHVIMTPPVNAMKIKRSKAKMVSIIMHIFSPHLLALKGPGAVG